ncbi:MAG: hypothetical protein KAV87_27080 [Desulfobacteraceae bacterium]|nr:hypothetical protein [Desulfobacteraceae bacterium]
MHAREEREITITMSPDELRDLADKMEKRFPNITIGGPTFVTFLHQENGFTINLNLDQGWFHKRVLVDGKWVLRVKGRENE